MVFEVLIKIKQEVKKINVVKSDTAKELKTNICIKNGDSNIIKKSLHLSFLHKRKNKIVKIERNANFKIIRLLNVGGKLSKLIIDPMIDLL